MARLTEEMVIARSKQSDLSAIKKLNCWGAELGDVSLIRRMPNVEVLALSINKIRSLDDFAGCRRLRELYIRKNEIRDLSEIRHLRNLPELTSLWLDENPCTTHPEYRMTVLRNLPNLEKLDNVSVNPDEIQEAMRRGAYIPDSDDEGYPQQETEYRQRRSAESSPEREAEPETYYRTPRPEQNCENNVSEAVNEAAAETSVESNQCPLSPPRRRPSEADETFEHPAMTRSHYEPRYTQRSPEHAPMRHSMSAQSVKEYTYAGNGECRSSVTSPPPHYHDSYYERPERLDTYQQVPQRSSNESERERASAREREYPSAVMVEHRGFTRRPVTRNSNLLSAVLCLVKELDYQNLEVAEMAIRCRMDELANSQ